MIKCPTCHVNIASDNIPKENDVEFKCTYCSAKLVLKVFIDHGFPPINIKEGIRLSWDTALLSGWNGEDIQIKDKNGN